MDEQSVPRHFRPEDKSLEASDNLHDPDVIVAEIAEELVAADFSSE